MKAIDTQCGGIVKKILTAFGSQSVIIGGTFSAKGIQHCKDWVTALQGVDKGCDTVSQFNLQSMTPLPVVHWGRLKLEVYAISEAILTYLITDSTNRSG